MMVMAPVLVMVLTEKQLGGWDFGCQIGYTPRHKALCARVCVRVKRERERTKGKERKGTERTQASKQARKKEKKEKKEKKRR